MFKWTKDYSQLAPSIHDASIMKTIDEGLKDLNKSWVAPIPFKYQCQQLPKRPQALHCLMFLKRKLEMPEMRDHFLSFMEKMFKKGHAELALPLSE